MPIPLEAPDANEYGKFKVEVAIPANTTSDYVPLPPQVRMVSVAIHPTVPGTARVEYTVSSRDRLIAGTARWLTWPLGTLSAADADTLMSSASAIRGVATDHDAVMEITAVDGNRTEG
jgi:hypothetical protein